VCDNRIFICIAIQSFSYPEKQFTADVQNVGLRVNLRYYQVILEMRNLNATCAIANLRWMNFKCLLLIDMNSRLIVIKSEIYNFKLFEHINNMK